MLLLKQQKGLQPEPSLPTQVAKWRTTPAPASEEKDAPPRRDATALGSRLPGPRRSSAARSAAPSQGRLQITGFVVAIANSGAYGVQVERLAQTSVHGGALWPMDTCRRGSHDHRAEALPAAAQLSAARPGRPGAPARPRRSAPACSIGIPQAGRSDPGGLLLGGARLACAAAKPTHLLLSFGPKSFQPIASRLSGGVSGSFRLGLRLPARPLSYPDLPRPGSKGSGQEKEPLQVLSAACPGAGAWNARALHPSRQRGEMRRVD